MVRLHPDEVEISDDVVAALIASQFPDLAHLPLSRFAGSGTVNAIYRLGDHLCARLPLTEGWAGSVGHERRWLARLAPHLPLRVPEPVAIGEPGAGYPFPWAIYRWIEGDGYSRAAVVDEAREARRLAEFVKALRTIDSAGAPRGGRPPLVEVDLETRQAIEQAHEIDRSAAMSAWEHSLNAPPWQDEDPVWVHSDLLPSNLLLRDGRLVAVLDFGAVAIGDQAMDLIPAWSVFGSVGRAAYRDALQPDDGVWHRARGIALSQALLIIPYYRESNPRFARDAMQTVAEVLSDLGSGAA